MKKRKKSQEDKVLAYLKKYTTLNRLQADRRWSVLRLGGIIYTLRAKGYRIMTEFVNVDGHRGIARYRFIGGRN